MFLGEREVKYSLNKLWQVFLQKPNSQEQAEADGTAQKISFRGEGQTIHWMNRWRGVGGVMGCEASSHR